MRKLIFLLAILPMLVSAEQALGRTSDGDSNQKTVAAPIKSVLPPEQLSVYQHAGDWEHFAELVDLIIKKYPPKNGEHAFADSVGKSIYGDIGAINETAWAVFLKCDNKAVLKQALSWSEQSILLVRPTPSSVYPMTARDLAQFLDTKANLLYKLGRVDEAMATEQAAIAQVIADEKQAGRAGGPFLDGLNATIEKMRKGEPTWPPKPVIDIHQTVYDKWPTVSDEVQISNDGQYVTYSVKGQPDGSSRSVVMSANGGWRKEWNGNGGAGTFTADSRLMVVLNSDHTLALVALGGELSEIPHVASFNLSGAGTGAWLAYQTDTAAKELIVRNLTTGVEKTLAAAADYWFSDDGKVLVFKTESREKETTSQTLNWLDLGNGAPVEIWRGAKMDSVHFDRSDTQLTFLVARATEHGPVNSLWYYKAGTNQAVELIGEASHNLAPGLKLQSLEGFSRDGGRLFLMVGAEEPLPRAEPAPNTVRLDVWSYKDSRLQSEQLRDVNSPVSAPFTEVFLLDEQRMFALAGTGETVGNLDAGEEGDDFAVISQCKFGRLADQSREESCRYYLASTKDGTRKLVSDQMMSWPQEISPGGKYFIYYDGQQKAFFSQETKSGIVRNLTRGISTTWSLPDPGDVHNRVRGVAGWTQGDESLLLYDQYDVWQLDPTNGHPPLNLTNGYGRRHDIVFDLALPKLHHSLSPGGQVMLSAFDRRTKDNGFFVMVVGKKGDPEQRSMGPYLYFSPSQALYAGHEPLKAANADSYVVRRTSATESPNYFYTTDFKNFTPLSDVHPERQYNWLTAELLTWKSLDGSELQGVLYKPENFDPRKKYPVIIYPYEKQANNLHEYLSPAPVAGGAVNVPYFASNGYLVFWPDIRYKPGEPGRDALNSVLSGANYLAQFSWVNAQKIGIQGHSFGSFETNYIVTHTHRFAAACSASGVSDLVSFYGSLSPGRDGSDGYVEGGQHRMGGNLWQLKKQYIAESPILNVDAVETPILLMYNKEDAWNYPQGIELYLALHRLGKKAWMLQYDDGKHVVVGAPAMDFTLRMAQFFDYYLKGVSPPKWMTEGIPARLKGIDMGLETDTSGKIP
jgi:dienelactone hydrolase